MLTKVLALVSDHVDLLLEDWYPSLGKLTMSFGTIMLYTLQHYSYYYYALLKILFV